VFDGEADSVRDLLSFSSRGPTDDGRRKPELVAPGSHVTNAAAQNSPRSPDQFSFGDTRINSTPSANAKQSACSFGTRDGGQSTSPSSHKISIRASFGSELLGIIKRTGGERTPSGK